MGPVGPVTSRYIEGCRPRAKGFVGPRRRGRGLHKDVKLSLVLAHFEGERVFVSSYVSGRPCRSRVVLGRPFL
jgi:hypothetical protein